MMAWIKRSHFHEFSKKNWIRVDLSSEFDPFSITFKIESLSKIIHGISETIIQPVPGFRLMRRPLVEFTRIFKGMGGFLLARVSVGGCHGSSVRGTFQPLFFTGFRNGGRRPHLRFVHGPIKYDRCSGSCGFPRVSSLLYINLTRKISSFLRTAYFYTPRTCRRNPYDIWPV